MTDSPSTATPPGGGLPPARILFAGSRSLTWAYLDLVRDLLLDLYAELPARCGSARVAWDRPPVLLHGACAARGVVPGGDVLADRAATQYLRWPVERWPADWHAPCREGRCRHGRRRRGPDGREFCPAAGLYRTDEMIASAPQACLVVIRQGSAGATYCADTARAAGIHTVRRVTA